MNQMKKKKLPVGVESFEKIRIEDFYYIDKTGMIRSLLQNWGEVNLFTRPRRFGKSLNMSMLKSFFEIGSDKSLFEGLKISKETELCNEYMGKFPVVSVSLKSVNADTYEKARNMAVKIINEEARHLQYLLESEQLTSYDKDLFSSLLKDNMKDETLCSSLREISELLHKHYRKKVIILIDEYDVPLAKANEKGYYDQMVMLIRNMFEQTLKTNDNLYFAVLTGCLRVAKESIFTGLNNMNVLSITDVQYDEYFGFTDEEVRELLAYYKLSGVYDTVKEWYDGYRFGNVDVYCPWDVICYCDKRRVNEKLQPEDYWSNTSSNDVVRHFLEQAKATTKREIEQLISGESVTKIVRQELTYKDLYDSIDNIWSVLFTTGYLTQKGEPDGRKLQLAIPNTEIRNIFTNQISEWFQETARRDGAALDAFCEAFGNGDAESAEKQLNHYLNKTISIRDTAVKKDMKENFYHGLLLGLLSYKDTWYVASNKETGDGYSDILIEIEEENIGIIIEVKYPDNGNMEQGCKEALEQIEARRYTEQLLADGMENIMKYGISCYRKKCRIMLECDRI